MFWDRVAGVYDLFVDVYNRKVHEELKCVIASEIAAGDTVLECSCGTGMLSVVIAPRCRRLIATDFSEAMRKRTEKKCRACSNVDVQDANILSLSFPDGAFDTVVAANVIHLLDAPYRALGELDRVCKDDGKIVIPTYMNKEKTGEVSRFSKTLGKAGADFKQAFTFRTYQEFFKKGRVYGRCLYDDRGAGPLRGSGDSKGFFQYYYPEVDGVYPRLRHGSAHCSEEEIKA